MRLFAPPGCITEPGETYGQVIFYRQGFKYDATPNDFDYNVTLVTDVDSAQYFSHFLSSIQNESE